MIKPWRGDSGGPSSEVGRRTVPEGPAQAEFHLRRARRGLMRRRKPRYDERGPRPGICVIGARRSELVRR